MAAYSDAELEALMSDLESDLVERKESAADLPFDLRAVNGAHVGDLDQGFVRNHYLPNAIAPDVLERNVRPLEHQLRSLRLVQGERPTWGAVIAFGLDPQAFAPGAYVQFLRIDGTEITDPIRDRKQLKPADGAIGGHANAVQRCYRDFRALARTVARRCGVAIA